MSLEKELPLALKNFLWDGPIKEVQPYGNGHINSTFLVEANSFYILQRLNKNVFTASSQTMANLVSVTLYLQKILAKTASDGVKSKQEALALVKNRSQSYAYEDSEGYFWRAFHLRKNSESFEEPRNEKEFYEGGYAFGSFLYALRDYPVATLYVTIPHFHDTPFRFRTFQAIREKDPAKRASSVSKEITYLTSKADFYPLIEERLLSGKLPYRVTHNDAKFNNLLFDKTTHEVVTVLDLDTVMPGSLLYDFGDGARSACDEAEENERDLRKTAFSLTAFASYAKGYLAGVHGALTAQEYSLLAESVLLMAEELALRFLGDYLAGDVYFGIHYPKENLVRALNQIALAQDIERKLPEMKRILEGAQSQ